MSKEAPGYISYLLRLWQVRTEGKMIWRASLESPKTGERVGFISPANLFAFLTDKMAISPDEEHKLNDTKKGEK